MLSWERHIRTPRLAYRKIKDSKEQGWAILAQTPKAIQSANWDTLEANLTNQPTELWEIMNHLLKPLSFGVVSLTTKAERHKGLGGTLENENDHSLQLQLPSPVAKRRQETASIKQEQDTIKKKLMEIMRTGNLKLSKNIRI